MGSPPDQATYKGVLMTNNGLLSRGAGVVACLFPKCPLPSQVHAGLGVK